MDQDSETSIKPKTAKALDFVPQILTVAEYRELCSTVAALVEIASASQCIVEEPYHLVHFVNRSDSM